MRRGRISRKPKTKSIGWFKKKLDHSFSQWIRIKDAVNGVATCVTCGAKAHWKKMQNGHYIPRSHMSTRYDEQNCHVQCVADNMFKNGAMDEYALFLVSKYGEDILEELNKRKHTIRQIRIPEYEELIKLYDAKVKELNV